MESKKIFWTGNDVILWHHSLSCDAIIGSIRQHFGNAVNIKVEVHITMKYFLIPYNIHITIYIKTTN